MHRATPAAALPRGATALFAVACGTAVANVYFAQPLLVALGNEFAIAPAALGAVVTLTQIGYGLGLFLIVPLGDRLDPRRLITVQLLLLAAALLFVATATSSAALLAGMASVGLLAVVTQSLVACAASFTEPARRGRVVGTVTSGVVTGILLARTVSGLLGDLAGWRSVYLTSAVLTCAAALALHRVVPRRDTPAPTLGYGRLLTSTVRLFTRERLPRLRALFALLVFAAFSTLWSSVTLVLSDPPMSLSSTAIGAFGLLGAAGALAANAAGRLNDRGHANRTTGFGLALLTLSWLPLALTRHSLWALAAGVVLLDLAVQAVHVTNQSLIHALHPEAGSRLIGGYMVFYSIGSAAGALAATTLYAAAGWSAVCVLGAGFSGLALVVWALTESGATRPAGKMSTTTHAPAGARPRR
ncbi:MFS transporter [Streptomyces sp. NPDC024089]|uniref:MFS transporter n=1 Tax=Streptomyces sp. NPDC024089 TaxID=3154328 RepID=UPI0033CAD5C4